MKKGKRSAAETALLAAACSEMDVLAARDRLERSKAPLEEHGNRTYEAVYLSKGERALILRTLKHFVHDQHQMISQAHEKYKKKNPAIFADHKLHHQKQIAAADDLADRLRGDGWKAAPNLNQTKKG